MASNIAENWKTLSGESNWSGLLNPLTLELRQYLIHYGEMTQATYENFISDPASKNAGNYRYARKNMLSNVGITLGHPMTKYTVTKYFYATSSLPLPNAFLVKSFSREAWNKESNWIGYVAVATDEGKAVLGRRDIVVCWRGTIQTLEWVNDLQFLLVLAPEIFGESKSSILTDKPRIHQGWYSLYTSVDERSPFNITSARDQVLSEVSRLVELYKNEEISVTVGGHSLGAAMATLNATDIAVNGIHKPKDMPDKVVPVTAFPFASPLVGDFNYKRVFDSQQDLRVLRTRNVLDVVPTYPPLGYFEVGQELVIDTMKSEYIKPPGNISNWHNLEAYMHGIAGTQGLLGGFKLVINRDIALVNKGMDGLKDEYAVPVSWWTLKHKGMVQQEDGSWVMIDHEEDDDEILP